MIYNNQQSIEIFEDVENTENSETNLEDTYNLVISTEYKHNDETSRGTIIFSTDIVFEMKTGDIVSEYFIKSVTYKVEGNKNLIYFYLNIINILFEN